jgi:hypothetical protein
MNKEPLLIWSSTLAALQVIAGGAAFADVIGVKAAGLFVLAVAALQTFTQFYVRGKVTAATTVVAKTDGAGKVVAGPASPIRDGEPVDVVPTATPAAAAA